MPPSEGEEDAERRPLSGDTGDTEEPDTQTSMETPSLVSVAGRIPVLGHLCMAASCLLVTVIACYVKVMEVRSQS